MSREEQDDLLGDESFSESLLEHLDEIPRDIQRKWPKDLAALIDIYEASLKRQGLDNALARRLAHFLLAELANYCGGRHIYLPKGDRLKHAIRDVDLFRDWRDRGLSPDHLAGKYKISVQHVYRILNEQRTLHLRRVQPDLF